MNPFWYDDLLVFPWLPEGKSGNWQVKRNPVIGDREQWLRLNKTEGRDRRLSYPAIYTELWHGKDMWMIDRPIELLTIENFVLQAKGDVLILGLGMGVLPSWLAKRADVNRIDIVENSADVYSLVAPHLLKLSPKINIIRGDANQYQPKRIYDHLWADIWLKPDPAHATRLQKHYSETCRQIDFWVG